MALDAVGMFARMGIPTFGGEVKVATPQTEGAQQTAGTQEAQGQTPAAPVEAEKKIGDMTRLVDAELKAVKSQDIQTSLDKATLKHTLEPELDGLALGFIDTVKLQSLRKSAEKTLGALNARGDDWHGVYQGGAKPTRVEKDVEAAVGAQFKLAEGLRATAAKLGGPRAAQLNQLAHEAEMRACQITQLASAAAKGETQLNSTRASLENFIDRYSLLLKGADSVLAEPEPSVAHVASVRFFLTIISSDLEEASRSGLSMDSGVTVRNDAAFAALRSRVDELTSRLDAREQIVARNVATRYADDFLLPDVSDMLSFLPNTTDDVTKSLRDDLDFLGACRALTQDVIDGKRPMADLRQQIAHVPQKLGAVITGLARAQMPDAVKPKVTAFVETLRGLLGLNPEESVEQELVKCPVEHAVDHLERILTLQTKPGNLQRADLLAVLKMEGGFSKAVEARLHGFELTDIEPMERAGAKVEITGQKQSGQVNQVVTLKYTDTDPANPPVMRIFKPERAARYGFNKADGGLHAFSALDAGVEAVHLNMASQETADLLGCGDRVCKAHVATYEGVFGMSLERAPGCPVKDLNSAGEAAQQIRTNLAGMPEEQRIHARAEIARQLNQLEWIDLINGQVDRHNGNYMLHVSQEGQVRVTGIDNDLAFPDRIVGLNRFRISRKEFTMLACDYLTVKGEKAEYKRGQGNEEEIRKFLEDCKGVNGRCRTGIEQRPDGTTEYLVDLDELPSAARAIARGSLFGPAGSWILKTAVVPKVMDEQMCERVRELTNDPNCSQFRAVLAKRHLSEDQIQAAVARLKDVREKIDQGKVTVLRAADWGESQVQADLRRGEDLMDLVPENMRQGIPFLMADKLSQTLNGYFADPQLRQFLDDARDRPPPNADL